MSPLLIFGVIFVGLTTFVASLRLIRRESCREARGWGSRRGLGTLCLLTAGAGLILSCVHGLLNWDPSHGDVLSSRWPLFEAVVMGTLALLAVGLGLRAAGGPAGGMGIDWEKGVLGSSVVVALLLTLTGLAVVQMFGIPILGRWIIREVPRTEVAVTPAPPRQPGFGKKYEFSADWFSWARPIWEIVLADYRGKPNVRYLEIGVFEGRSALWMLENILTDSTASLTGIDPFFEPEKASGKSVRTYKDVFYSNLALSGFERKTRIIEGFSQIELRKLPLASFDIVYIDGSHTANDALEDAILSWRLLKDNGLMIIDDYGSRSFTGVKRAVDTFFAFFGDDFQPIHVGAQVILKKQPRDRSLPGERR
ncbi:MAG: class I SAM-dependent methyltransferase [Verrucomicrobia bacterium]|nr:class I SAM-dependent methyltransferase [Verrucomicrobiota bacterium]